MRRMYLAYIDDSGDKGANGSRTFTLGVILVPAHLWPAAFNDLIAFRRFLKANYGIPVRAELKANYLLGNRGPLRDLKLSEGARYRIYRAHLRLVTKIGGLAYAVVIRKALLAERQPDRDPFDVAWEYTLQRLERFTTKNGTHVLIMHDEGEPDAIRKLVRKARRAGTAGSAFGTGYLKVPADRIVDDPVSRVSTQSYFLQLADLAAYAAFRNVDPPPARAIQIVPQEMWDELGQARLLPVSQNGPPGIVRYP